MSASAPLVALAGTRGRAVFALPFTLALAGCAYSPPTPPSMPRDASSGRAPAAFDPARACGAWHDAAGTDDAAAQSHASFPELDPKSCYVPVRYTPSGVSADPAPAGCGYPEGPEAGSAAAPTAEHLQRAAERYLRIAEGAAGDPLPSRSPATGVDRLRLDRREHR
jgi:hypothetical protein